MKKTLVIVGCVGVLSVGLAIYGQTTGTRGQTPNPTPARQTVAPRGNAAPAASQAASQPGVAPREVLDQYCMACHSEKAKTSTSETTRNAALRLTLDDKDLSRVGQNAEFWEKVVRKLRAGMMPPSGMRRPEPAVLKGTIAWLENELDRNAVMHLPPPGLHRLNRTEYANAVRDLLALEIDPARLLPSDDSTAGFDNIAGALGISSTLVEAYVSAAGKISRMAIGEPASQSLFVKRAAEDDSQDYHIPGLPFGTRGGVVFDYVFPSDGDYTITVTPIFGDNMSPTGFGSVPCEKLLILMDGERQQLLDWQGGGRGGGGNCGGGAAGRGGQGNRGGGAAAAPAGQAAVPAAGQAAAQGAPQRGGGAPQTAAAVPAGAANPPATANAATAPAAGQPAAQANNGGGGGGGGGRGGGGMRITVKTTAGSHRIGVTYLATNFAPVLDLEKHFMRDTLQTGPTPGYTFFPHVGTVRIEGPLTGTAKAAKDSPSRRQIFTCKPTGPADETNCASKIITTLATRAFRQPVSAGDLAELMKFYQEGRKEVDFDRGIQVALQRILAAPKFVYRIEVEPASQQAAQSYRISDLELASRLSFFLWSTAPDDTLRNIAVQGKLKDPVVLEQQVRRMLKDPRSEALSINFAGQWLNLRGMQAVGPLPHVYPDFDDPLRQAMRREVELLFNSIVAEDHNVVELLTADYTFVNERLAKHYGMPNIYGSRFRRVTLPQSMDLRRGLLGKGAFLTTTAKPERTSPVTRGKWIITNILGMSPPDPPMDVPPLPAKADNERGNAKTPSMREIMTEHKKSGSACAQCHVLMDPIGFSLENFDGIALWRTQDEGNAIDATSTVFDGTKIDGPSGLRQWLVGGYSDQFVEVMTEKLLTYALGRGVEYQDMPLVRSIARNVGRNNNRFSSMVLAIVNSKPFQMNMKVTEKQAE